MRLSHKSMFAYLIAAGFWLAASGACARDPAPWNRPDAALIVDAAEKSSQLAARAACPARLTGELDGGASAAQRVVESHAQREHRSLRSVTHAGAGAERRRPERSTPANAAHECPHDEHDRHHHADREQHDRSEPDHDRFDAGHVHHPAPLVTQSTTRYNACRQDTPEMPET